MNRAEFLKALKSEGYDMPDRVLTDWIVRGLVGRPEVGSDGFGVEPDYPADQLRLTIELLRLHRPGHSLDQLYNIPVGVWLYWHNHGIVGLPQVRRAMNSWAERRTRGGRSDRLGATAARQLASQFQAAGISEANTERLYEGLRAANATGRLDMTKVDAAVSGLAHDPEVRAMVRLITQLAAGITDMKAFSDDDFRQARAEHLAQLPPGYRRQDREQLVNIQDLVENACHDLTLHLGDLHLRSTNQP